MFVIDTSADVLYGIIVDDKVFPNGEHLGKNSKQNQVLYSAVCTAVKFLENSAL